jgi:AcrR family transcriptional regulator
MTIGQLPDEERQEKTRARILDVALELIAKQGFAATSTREISERLGFSKAALYYHFRTKDELLNAIVAPAMAHLSAVVGGKSARSAAGPRRELLAAYIDLVATHEALIRVLSEDPSVNNRPALLAAVPLYERLTQLLSGKDEPDTSLRARVRVALGGIHAAILHALPDDDPQVVGDAAFSAACDALGIAAPRGARPVLTTRA